MLACGGLIGTVEFLCNPFDLFLRAMKTGRGDYLDPNSELPFQGDELEATCVLKGIGKLGMKRNAHNSLEAFSSSGIDSPKKSKTYQLGAGDSTCAFTSRAGSVSPEQQSLLDSLAIDL